MKKISILYESMQSVKPDDYYRDVIVQPALRKVMTGQGCGRNCSWLTPAFAWRECRKLPPHIHCLDQGMNQALSEYT